MSNNSESKPTLSLRCLNPLQDSIGSVKQVNEQVADLKSKFDDKCKEIKMVRKCHDTLLSEHARLAAQSKYFAQNWHKTRIEKEKLEHKMSEGPLDIVEIIKEMKYETDMLYDVMKNYHLGVQKSVQEIRQAIMENNNPQEIVKRVQKCLDSATIEASARFCFESDAVSNKSVDFARWLQENSFNSLPMKPIPSKEDIELMDK